MVLELQHIYKTYDQGKIEVPALKDICFEMEEGEYVAVMGPSGSGKTTILRCINFLEKASEGTMEFDGETFDLSSMNHRDIHRLRMKTAFVFQNYNLFANMTVLRNVEIGLTAARGIGKQEAEETALKMLKKVGLADKKDAYPSQLSGGQQQRVAIARMFLKNPPIIFLDEPTASLDAVATEQIKNSIDAIKQNRTVIIISHSISQIIDSDVIYDLKEGRVEQGGNPDEVYKQAASTRRSSMPPPAVST
jgi:ABC-type polar amino acid transport system ATPase subunit